MSLQQHLLSINTTIAAITSLKQNHANISVEDLSSNLLNQILNLIAGLRKEVHIDVNTIPVIEVAITNVSLNHVHRGKLLPHYLAISRIYIKSFVLFSVHFLNVLVSRLVCFQFIGCCSSTQLDLMSMEVLEASLPLLSCSQSSIRELTMKLCQVSILLIKY
jgi:hypothetical protein